MKETKSTCPYCGVGCGVIIQSDGDQITGVRGDAAHPANFGRLCTKGSTLHLSASATVTRHARLLHPMLRSQRGAPNTDAASALSMAGLQRPCHAHLTPQDGRRPMVKPAGS